MPAVVLGIIIIGVLTVLTAIYEAYCMITVTDTDDKVLEFFYALIILAMIATFIALLFG